MKLLKMQGIVKKFGGIEILHGVDFELDRGEVHALIGENGAGKSTLIKVLAGVHEVDGGEIYLEDCKIRFRNPKEALEHGISTIHQEFNLVPYLDVASNIFLGRESRNAAGIIKKDEIYRKTQVLLDRIGAEFGPGELVADLGVAEKQMVEICKAMSLEAKIMIMDEPTAVLSEKEIEKLFAIIHRIRQEGAALIYISHRLDELLQIADKVTVLRDGAIVGNLEKHQLSKDVMTTMMIGRELSEQFPKADKRIGEVVLDVKGITSGKNVKDVSFALHRGEILGFSGLVGAGRTELMRAVMGIDKPKSGQVYLDGEEIRCRSARDAKKKGIVLIPEERKTEGLVLSMSIEDNIALTYEDTFSFMGILSKHKLEKNAEDIIEKLTIRPADRKKKAQNLSGGNQQKIVIGKWIYKDHKVLVFDEPTRGVDVGAKAEIYKVMAELAGKGIGIIMVSSDLPEIIGMSDRVLVMKEGRVSGELKREELEEDRIMKYAF